MAAFPTDGTEQSHFEVYHLSRSNDLPDRTRFVLGLSQENPAGVLAVLQGRDSLQMGWQGRCTHSMQRRGRLVRKRLLGFLVTHSMPL